MAAFVSTLPLTTYRTNYLKKNAQTPFTCSVHTTGSHDDSPSPSSLAQSLQHPPPTASTVTETTRRTFMHLLTFATLATLAPSSAHAADNLEKLSTPIVMCRRLMGPIPKYIAEGAWDKGRTNVNYCTRVLAMRRNIRQAAELLQGDAYYDALEIMGDMENVMSQLDASLYTGLFIPTDDDGTVALEQRVYQQQAVAFYEQAVAGLDRFLGLLPNDVLQKAVHMADNAKYEIKIERD